MKKLFFISVFLFSILFSNRILATNPEWIVYTRDSAGFKWGENYVDFVAVDNSNRKWCNLVESVVIYNDSSWEYFSKAKYPTGEEQDFPPVRDIVFNFQNAIWIAPTAVFPIRLRPGQDTIIIDIPMKWWAVGIETDGNYLWIGTSDTGLVRYDGTNFTLFNDYNGALPFHYIEVHCIDSSGVFWLAGLDQLLSWDGNNWTIYADTNSPLPRKYIVRSVSVDRNNNKWITFYQAEYFDSVNNQTCRIAKFDGENWTLYDTSNVAEFSRSSVAYATYVAFDSQGNKWISTLDGLLKLDDSTWTRFTPENSGLPHRLVFHVAVDHYDNVWAATYEGLAVYHEGGVVFSRPSGDIPEMKALTDFIFPNPANGMVEIHYEALQAGIVKFELYTISGKFISSVMTTVAQPGNYTQTMDLSGLPSGTYLIKVKIGNRTEAKKVVLSK